MYPGRSNGMYETIKLRRGSEILHPEKRFTFMRAQVLEKIIIPLLFFSTKTSELPSTEFGKSCCLQNTRRSSLA
jgi:hypothetical protein